MKPRIAEIAAVSGRPISLVAFKRHMDGSFSDVSIAEDSTGIDLCSSPCSSQQVSPRQATDTSSYINVTAFERLPVGLRPA